MIKLLYISGAFILSCAVILYYKSISTIHKLRKDAKAQSKRNVLFVNERIWYIEDYFENDPHFELVTNRYKGNIVGFFLKVRKGSSEYDEIKERNLPVTSHELTIDEFCIFIDEYLGNLSDREQIVRELMRKHSEILKWD